MYTFYIVNRTSLKYVEAKEKELKEKAASHNNNKDEANNEEDNEPVTVLEHFLMKSGMDKKDIVSVVCDTLLAGADTVMISLSYFFLTDIIEFNIQCNLI